MQCCLCKQEIPVEHGSWHEGHNADPVADGRCCRECNIKEVIPARLRGLITDDALQAIIELESTWSSTRQVQGDKKNEIN